MRNDNDVKFRRSLPLLRLRSAGIGAALVVALAASTGCSRMGDFATTSSPSPRPLASSSQQQLPDAPSAPPIALAPEEGAPVATLGPEAAQLPVDGTARSAAPVAADAAASQAVPRKKLLSPEEKAAIIAELEALARQQSAR